MTDRVHGFVVTLDEDIRVDDVNRILDAIRMVKHVVSVEPVTATVEDHMARQRVRAEIVCELYQALDRIWVGKSGTPER